MQTSQLGFPCSSPSIQRCCACKFLLVHSIFYLAGCGIGMIYMCWNVALGHYFKRHMVLAYGIASLGAGIGGLVLPPIVDALLTWLSWREVLGIVGCICLQTCVCGALLRPLDVTVSDVTETTISGGSEQREDVTETETGRSGVCSAKFNVHHKPSSTEIVEDLVCSAAFMFFCAAVLASGIGISAVYFHLSAFTITQGATRREAALYLTVIGSGSVVGRGLAGLAGNDPSVNVLTLYMGASGFLGLCTIFFPFLAAFYYARMLYAGLFGLYSGTNAALLGPITVELLGVEKLNVAFGMETFVCGAAFFSGPFFAGKNPQWSILLLMVRPST